MKSPYTLGALALALLIIGGVAVYVAQPDDPVTPPDQAVVVNTPRTTISETDSDGDGLKDWEEALWNTDPSNPDTDGDGTTDGKEVAESRNPTVGGPDDVYTESTSTKPATYTEQAGQDILSGVLTGAGTSSIVAVVEDSLEAGMPVFTPLTAANITIIPGGTDALRTYGQAVDRILDTVDTASLAQVESAGDITDPDTLAAFAQVGSAYAQVFAGLRALAVPSDVVAYHLAYTNAVGESALQLQTVEYLLVDPLVGLGALVALAESGEHLTTARAQLAFFLKSTSGYTLRDRVY